jgi:hypothetical protein
MLKYENLANIGDVIRAYDFMGNKEAFIEGTIIAKGAVHTPSGQYMYEAYTIKIEKDGADWNREGDEGYIPFETSMDYDGRVELIDWDNRAEEELAIAMMQEVA